MLPSATVTYNEDRGSERGKGSGGLVDAAIFGSAPPARVTYNAAQPLGGEDQPCRSHVARQSAAFRLLFPFSFFVVLFLPLTFATLDPTRS
jgi:hypothetical protein